MQQKDLAIRNKLGLHARPASVFVEAAQQFASQLTVVKNGKRVNAKSILSLMSLDIRSGDVVTLEADGPDESSAVAALSDLVQTRLAESD
jgi:phosphotransferase system HPr (HPr) family protein